MADTVLTLFHQEDSKSGRLGARLAARGFQLEACCPATGDVLPQALDGYAGVVSFGGGMSANDEHLPFIQAELDWLPQVMAAEVPLLGVCLGAQLILRALGGEVKSHPDNLIEVGYYAVEPTEQGSPLFDGVDDEPLSFYQWHKEGFRLTPEIVPLATGGYFGIQAFRYGCCTYGLQFHPEVTEEMMNRHFSKAAEMLSWPGAKSRSEIEAVHPYFTPKTDAWIDRLLDVWLGLRF